MDKKHLFGASLLATPNLVSAQISGSGSMTSIPELITQLTGIQINDPYGVLGVLASLGVLWGVTYVTLKVSFKKLDILDTVTPGGGKYSEDGGRNILAIISLLVVLSMAGTGAFGAVISSWQALVGLTFGVGILVLFAYLLIGGSGAVLGGGSYLAGKSAKATVEGGKEGAEALNEAKKLLGSGEQEEKKAEEEAEEAEKREQTGDPEQETVADEEAEDAVEHLETALKEFQSTTEDIQGVLQKDWKQLNTTLEELEQTFKVEEDEEKHIKRLAQLPQDVIESVGKMQQSLGGVEEPREKRRLAVRYGEEEGVNNLPVEVGDIKTFPQLAKEAESLSGDLQTLVSEVKEEKSEEDEEFKELVTEIKELAAAYEMLKELEGDVQFAEKTDEELETIAQQIGDKELYKEAEYEEGQEKQLIEELQSLEEEESQLTQALEKADRIVTQLMEMDQQELQQMREEGKGEQQAIELLNEYENQVDALVSGQQEEPLVNEIETLKDELGEIENVTEQISELKQGEENELEEVKSTIEKSLQKIEG